MIPYKFDEGAASKIANKLGSAASSAIQFRGKYKAGPLAAQEAEEKTAKDTADKKAKTEAKAAAATSARATKSKEELDQFQAKTDITTKARIKVKQTQTPAQKLAADKAKAAKNTTQAYRTGNSSEEASS